MKNKKHYQQLISWSKKTYGHLPWRVDRSFYNTLVSEIMLQQTTVGTVLNHFPLFIKKFPNLQSLADASEEDLAHAWKGLGYYRRAKNLLNAARALNKLKKIPQEIEELKKFPGIGDYTASAIRSIGFDQPALSLDANLERVLARIYGVEAKTSLELKKKINSQFLKGEIAQEIYSFSPRDFNEALMDLGRTKCQLRKTQCELCLFQKSCLASINDKVMNLPQFQENSSNVKNNVKNIEVTLYRLICEKNASVFLVPKNENQWLTGQWELPTFYENQDTFSDIHQKRISINFPVMNSDHKKLFDISENFKSLKSGITNYNFNNKCFKFKGNHKQIKTLSLSYQEGEWIEFSALLQKNLTSSTIKILKLFNLL